jgi:hypothetical protein
MTIIVLHGIFILAYVHGSFEMTGRQLLNLFFDTYNGLEVVYLAPFFLACSALEYRFKILNDRLKTAFSCEMSSLLKEVVPKGSKQTLFHIIKLYDELTDGLDLFNSVFTISVSLFKFY